VFVVDLEREIREVKRIAALYARRGRLPLAIQILETALQLQRGTYGEYGLQCADTAYQIAELMCDNNQFNEARQYFEKAVDIWTHHHPNETKSMMWYTDALTRLQQNAEDDEEDYEDERKTA
jgi:tetratricopeptide (TPR) repeat protein